MTQLKNKIKLEDWNEFQSNLESANYILVKTAIFNGIRQKKSEFNKFETYKIQLNKSKIK